MKLRVMSGSHPLRVHCIAAGPGINRRTKEESITGWSQAMGERHNSASSLARASICVIIIPGDLVIHGLNLLHPFNLAFHAEHVALVSVTATSSR